MPLLLWGAVKAGLAIAGVFAIGGFGFNQASQGVNTLSSALFKIAIGGGAIYYMGKKLKWL